MKSLIFAVIIAGLTVGASFFLRVPKARDVAGMNGFYLEENDSIDVVLIGPSPIYTDFYSPLAYEEQEFTSYSIATGVMGGTMYPSAIREVLATQDPQLYVFDLSAFCYEVQNDEAALRRWIDSIRNKDNRNETIEELVPEEEKNSYKIPFLKYHSNWTNIDHCVAAMFDVIAQKKRGYSITKSYTVYSFIDQDEIGEVLYDFSDEGLDALKKLLGFLKDQKINNVLFVRFPYKDAVTNGDRYLQGIDLILEADYDVLDYCNTTKNVHKGDIQFDYKRDYCDKEHLTVFGAEKLTKHLAEYINTQYHPISVHTPKTKERWDVAASYNNQVLESAKIRTLKGEGKEVFSQKELLKTITNP